MVVAASMAAIIFDGKAAAESLLIGLRQRTSLLVKAPRLAIVHFDPPDKVSPFVRQKIRAGEQAGVEVRLYPVAPDSSAVNVSHLLNQVAHEAHADGMIVQLPLPEHLDQNRYGLLRIIPREKNVDCLGEEWLGRMQTGRTIIKFDRGAATILPPVVASIAYIIEQNRWDIKGKRVAAVGWGDLVGKPCVSWFLQQGATVTVATSTERDLKAITHEADIIVSGAGKPGIITEGIVKEGSIIFDAGTSEVNGAVRGDVEIEGLQEKASFITPVPGGLGPLAVAMLIFNVVSVSEARQKKT